LATKPFELGNPSIQASSDMILTKTKVRVPRPDGSLDREKRGCRQKWTEKRRAEDRRRQGGRDRRRCARQRRVWRRVRGVSAEADCSHTLTLHLLPSPYAHIDFLWHLFLSYSTLQSRCGAQMWVLLRSNFYSIGCF